MKQLPFLSRPPSWSPAAANPRRPAVIVPLQSTDPQDIRLNAARIAATGIVDVIEWRIDPILAQPPGEPGAASPAAAILESAPDVVSAGLPVLLTLRTAAEGGAAELSEEAYEEIIGALVDQVPSASASPVAVDIEIDRTAAAGLITRAHESGCAVVASHHNFAGTDSPDALRATFDRMAEAGADVAKIAMMPANTHDVTAVLNATAEADARLSCPVLGISMGETGRATRILGADFGSCATFAQLGLASAPGQIGARELAALLDSIYG